MPENWVLNASPVIVLARINYASLFSNLADQVVVPQAVAREIQAGPADDLARKALETNAFTIVETPVPLKELFAWDLGEGETAVISLAMAEPSWTAILDDAVARRCARSFGIPVKGTLAIVIMAKQKGIISSAADVLRQLRSAGFHIDDRVIREALALTVGEAWEG